jgi:hypothetical protein
MADPRSSMTKISIRFFDDREVRAVWDENKATWLCSVLVIVAVLTDQDDYDKTRNYWKYLKAKLKREGRQVVSATTQLKLLAPDGKRRLTDVLDHAGIIALGKEFPSKKANRFIQWLTHSEESIDGKSRTKACALFERSFIDSIEVGTAKGPPADPRLPLRWPLPLRRPDPAEEHLQGRLPVRDPLTSTPLSAGRGCWFYFRPIQRVKLKNKSIPDATQT